MSGLAVGARLARERLRGVSAPLLLLLGASALFALGVLERRMDAAGAADRVLLGAVFGLALPIVAYLLSERVCAGQRLDRGVDCLARYGANRRSALLGMQLATALCVAVVSVLFTLAALLGAHSPGTPGLSSDLRASVGIALLAGAAYAVWFGAASLFGARGAGRKWALIFDFVLGSAGSSLGVAWPRAHVRNLLGGEPVLGLPQASAWFALAVIGIVSLTLSIARTSE